MVGGSNRRRDNWSVNWPAENQSAEDRTASGLTVGGLIGGGLIGGGLIVGGEEGDYAVDYGIQAGGGG